MKNIAYGLINVIIFGNYTWRRDNLFRIDRMLSRSAQMDAYTLDALILSKRINTVINLRGSNPGKQWYDEEKYACERRGVQLIDLRLCATALPSKSQVLQIIETQEKIMFPAHVHCRGGAERSGLFCGIYQLLRIGEIKSALTQVGPKYGVMNSKMRDFFRLYRESNAPNFRHWVNEVYQN